MFPKIKGWEKTQPQLLLSLDEVWDTTGEGSDLSLRPKEQDRQQSMVKFHSFN